MKKNYSLRKIRHLTYQNYQWYLKNGNKLPTHDRHEIEEIFQQLDEDFASNNKLKARADFDKLQNLIEPHRIKPFWKYPLELIGALAFALIVATIIRQMVFEPYEIPSGSMRPTFREKDHLVVSKTTFGINIPMMPGHFYFDEKLLPRGGIIIFSGEGVDLPDTDTRYFWLFPAKKRYIKRCMAKPFDSVYFYGGMLYGVDKDGNDLTMLRDPLFSQKLDHVPFNSFEGRAERVGGGKRDSTLEIIYKYFNKPIGKIRYSSTGDMSGLVFNGKEWIKDQPSALNTPHQEIKTFSDYYGIENFAMTRLLNKEEMGKLHPEIKLQPDAILYMELAHTPRLAPLGSNNSKKEPIPITGQLAYETSVIPLSAKEISTLMKSLYTARFTVSNGKAQRFDAGGFDQYEVLLPNVPDGTYEFYDGVAQEIGFMGYSTTLPPNHPLYQFTPRLAQVFFNYGIDFSTFFNPLSSPLAPFPARYAYFRDGNLYVMGHQFLANDDPLLTRFVEQEKKKSLPFIDRGPPLKDGKIDVDFIRTFGFTLGEKEYLALGDNYAMSSDSRFFGPVKQDNLEGTPAFILWPPQSRFGSPNAVPYPSFSLPTIIVWSLVGLISLAIYLYERKKHSLPIFKKRVEA